MYTIAGVLRAHHPTVPTAPPMKLPIPNSNPNPIFNPKPEPFFERKQKRHRNIGQHRVIFIGYFTNLRVGEGLWEAHKRKRKFFFFGWCARKTFYILITYLEYITPAPKLDILGFLEYLTNRIELSHLYVNLWLVSVVFNIKLTTACLALQWLPILRSRNYCVISAKLSLHDSRTKSPRNNRHLRALSRAKLIADEWRFANVSWFFSCSVQLGQIGSP